MPLGVGEFAEESPTPDPLASAGAGRRVNAGSMVIVLVIGVAIGGLWLMRKVTHVSAATGGNTEVELTIEKFLSALKGESGASAARTAPNSPDAGVLEVLKETYTERQVPLTDVQRNPFILYGETIVTADGPAQPDESNLARTRQRTERQEAFQRAASNLHLKSIIMGAEPLANVSGKIVRVGDEIASEPDNIAFRVSKITADVVTMVGEDKALEVKVEAVLSIKRFN